MVPINSGDRRVRFVALSIGWLDGAWKWQLPIGIPVSFVLTVITGAAVAVLNLAPDDFPITFYLWVWLIWFSVVVIIFGWTRAHWLLRTFSVIALVFCLVAAFTVVNQNYDYYPTLQRLLGKDAANFTDLPGSRSSGPPPGSHGKLPTHGDTIEVTIPALPPSSVPARPTSTSPRRGSRAPSPNCRS